MTLRVFLAAWWPSLVSVLFSQFTMWCFGFGWDAILAGTVCGLIGSACLIWYFRVPRG